MSTQGFITLEEAAERFMDPNRIESNAEIVALLSEEDRAIILEGVDMEEYLYDWSQWGRPKQIIPSEPYYNVHLLLMGRGYGKTRAMSEFARSKAMAVPGTRIALMGRTNGETRDILVSGESGVMSIPQPENERPVYKSAEGRVVWPNGSEAKILSAEQPDSARGGQYHYAIVDELAAHTPFVGSDGVTAFQNVRIATRLGERPTLVVATTPKKVQVLRDMIEESKDPTKSIRVVHGKTSENTSNLSSVYMDMIYGTYAGTSLARQELEGEMLDEEIEGALWSEEDIIVNLEMTEEQARRLPIRLVAVDPSVAENPNDECGIIVIGATNERAMYKRKAVVLEDASLKASPEVWAQEVVRQVKKWKAIGAVVEKNQGHHLLTMAIHAIDPNIRVFPVNAGLSKAARAEPVSQVYEQKRVTHLYPFPLLENQMLTWEPGVTKKSPDRCLVGTSQITMSDGSTKNISDVRVGDHVETRKGPRKVLAAEVTNPSAEVMSVRFDDGAELTGTAGHPVWVGGEVNNFVGLDTLVCGTIELWKIQSTPEVSPSTVRPTLDYLTQNNEPIESTTPLSDGQKAITTTGTSIGSITERFLKGIISIIRISTLSTTTLTTCRQSPVKNMGNCTLLNSRKYGENGCSQSFMQRLKNGTGLKKDWSFTGILQDSLGKVWKKQKGSAFLQDVKRYSSLGTKHTVTGSSTRKSAETSTTHSRKRLSTSVLEMDAVIGFNQPTRENTVRPPVDQARRAGQASHSTPLLRKNVRGVEQPSLGSGSVSTVGKNVVSKISEIVMVAEKVPVWNLTVEGENEYFANGILVHNCDALVWGITAAIIKPPEGLERKRLRSSLPGGRLPEGFGMGFARRPE